MNAPYALEVSGVRKSFGGTEVVKGISFTVRRGEVFGLVGPNGAGKTTTIRMLMDIVRADAGDIMVLGEPLQDKTKNRIGYLPEERGLYRRLTVTETISYLATLKGMTPQAAKHQAARLLERVGLAAHKDKKINELSRGMAQLIQFVVTLINDPDLVILDEPFSGLDPVNRRLLKEMVSDLRARGKTVLFSTHMMNEVEELCNRILMIDQGEAVLYGTLAEIKARFSNNSVLVEAEGDLSRVWGIAEIKERGAQRELVLSQGATSQEVLQHIVERGIKVRRFEIATPSLDEIFVRVVQEGR